MGKRAVDLILINPNCREQVYQGLGDLVACEPPLWCRLIAGYIKDRGFTVTIIDAEALNMPTEMVVSHIVAAEPLLVAVVAFGHQPSASTQMMVGVQDILSALKQQFPTIVVGGHVSALPLESWNEVQTRWICKGEGPVTIHRLLQWLNQPQQDPDQLKDIQGLCYSGKDGFVVNPSAPLLDPDKDLHGDVWALLPMEQYRAHNWQCFGDLEKRQPYASIYTSLGCPYKCSFCCINAPFDSSRYRMRSPEAVVGEIAHLYERYGVRTFKIIDEMFVLNDKHVSGICNRLIVSGMAKELNIWAYARVDTIRNQSQLEMMRAAGIQWLALGIESGSKHVRDGAEKRLKNDDIIGIVRMIQQAGINVIGNYIFGLPDDTQESMEETLDLACGLNCEFANFYSAMAYPGSALHKYVTEGGGGALPKSWSGYSQHSYDCQPLPTATLSSAEVLCFRDLAFQFYFRRPAYIAMVRDKFGVEAMNHIMAMVARPLPRKLLEAR